ncbi:helix-turn-helix domain-containing protein [Streptomyces uncialis]|uniref:helix-turn-helix domain-containing protein n=1 Tax=Streptomyces uncialis TaxID=1048205 RepID=UPI0033DEE984
MTSPAPVPAPTPDRGPAPIPDRGPADTAALRRRELGGFLRAHREQLAPHEVGLPSGSRRRTPGLRREEVAALSGVGVAWYTWLEQGRVETSRAVLDAVSRTLRLGAEQHGHVLRLAGYTGPPPDGEDAPDQVPGALRRMIGAWSHSPALVLDSVLDIAAWNTAWTEVWPDPGAVPEADRNLLLLLIGDPAHQRVLPDWEPVVIGLHRHFRGTADTGPAGRGVRELGERLRTVRPDLAHWWGCRSVGSFAPRTVRLTAREAGAGPASYELTLLAPGVGGGTHSVLVQTPVEH